MCSNTILLLSETLSVQFLWQQSYFVSDTAVYARSAWRKESVTVTVTKSLENVSLNRILLPRKC